MRTCNGFIDFNTSLHIARIIQKEVLCSALEYLSNIEDISSLNLDYLNVFRR